MNNDNNETNETINDLSSISASKPLAKGDIVLIYGNNGSKILPAVVVKKGTRNFKCRPYKYKVNKEGVIENLVPVTVWINKDCLDALTKIEVESQD